MTVPVLLYIDWSLSPATNIMNPWFMLAGEGYSGAACISEKKTQGMWPAGQKDSLECLKQDIK